MKRIIAILLVIAMALGMAACGGSAPSETEAPHTTAPATEAPTEATTGPTTEPTTEPTLSPEELLYNSLPDRMRQAVDAGIVELNQLEDLNRTVTVGEASEMLQKAYIHRTGVESKTLNDLICSADFSTRNATRGWIINVPGLADMELTQGKQYKNYEQWMKLRNKEAAIDLWDYFTGRNNIRVYATFDLDGSDKKTLTPDGGQYGEPSPIIETAADFSVVKKLMQSDLLYGPGEKDRRFLNVSDYALKIYDQTNGKKFFNLEDGFVNPERELTVAEAAEYALTYYNYPNPMDYPTFVSPENVGSFNPNIITADLLAKETSLPTPSCEYLPKEWHGTVMDDFQFASENLMHPDFEIYEYEIQKIKETGFNFVGLCLDFSWLQESFLMDKSKKVYNGFVDKDDEGKLSLERLEKLDQVIAWCIQYDIHVNLRCTALGGINSSVDMNTEINTHTDKQAGKLASLWQAVAQRYAQIPNEYLSFTLFTGDYPVKNSLILPAVESIRAVSPDRCIIADICSSKMNPETFADLGVALSYRLHEPGKSDSFFNISQYWGFVRTGSVFAEIFNKKGQQVVKNFTWPYKDKVDADVLFSDGSDGASLMNVMQTAQEYGVGFMLGEFGITIGGNWMFTLDRTRYADEPYYAMITDITSTIEALGYGWCFAHWYSPYGVAFCLPAVKTSAYEQVEDYPYYIDQGMLELFQTINGVR